MNKVEDLVQTVITEAAADEKIDSLVSELIKGAINTLDPSLVINDYEAASLKYYDAINAKLARRLKVTRMEAPSYITTYMRREFKKAIKKYHEQLNKGYKDLQTPTPR